MSPAPAEPRSVFEAARLWHKNGLTREQMIAKLAERGLDEESALDIINNAAPVRPSAAAIAAHAKATSEQPLLESLKAPLRNAPPFKMNADIGFGALLVLLGLWRLLSGNTWGIVALGFGVWRLVRGFNRT